MKDRGFTLIEVMMAVAIFAGALVAFAGFYLTTARLAESSRNMTQAMNDARTILETIRDTAQSGGLTGGTGVTGVFPAGTPIAAPTGVPWSLTSETLSASYSSPAADPLPVTVLVSWTEWGRARTALVDTMVTRR